MFIYVLALLIGVVAGLRAMTAPAAVAWAAYLGWINLDGSWLSFLSHWLALLILTLLAVAELVTDQLPSTPSRKVPVQFATRIFMGAVCGAAIGFAGGVWVAGLIAGAIGAVIGTLGGYEARRSLVAATGGKDLPIALIEDGIAIALALWIVAYVT
ncbi:DUF4126 family protein [Kaistia defluvii]|uniref:DUF4126 family protein n=1 Tax=Kaistia defluvii TaxID=410841 RepID=UPI0022581F54|nr:DUF4126 family protein [Kaistia defluvii]MCX5517133.1 DUF4126 family protein [Kaistia defluvii]